MNLIKKLKTGYIIKLELKETIIGYYFLLLEKKPISKNELDKKIEDWIYNKTGIKIEFEVTDSLNKMIKLGLCSQSKDKKYSAISLDKSIKKIGKIWDNYF